MNRFLFPIVVLSLLLSCSKPAPKQEEQPEPEPEPTFYMDHEYVDLGLPSGILWAACNVNAALPGESGDYFAWGELEPKENYDWTTYKYCDGKASKMTKYCQSTNFGEVDYKTVLEPSDDVAAVEWGGNWRMPTQLERSELVLNCKFSLSYKDGNNVLKITGPNGNSIYVPTAGYRLQKEILYGGECCYFWTSTLYSAESCYSYCIFAKYNFSGWDKEFRCIGMPVRPVFVPEGE